MQTNHDSYFWHWNWASAVLDCLALSEISWVMTSPIVCYIVNVHLIHKYMECCYITWPVCFHCVIVPLMLSFCARDLAGLDVMWVSYRARCCCHKACDDVTSPHLSSALLILDTRGQTSCCSFNAKYFIISKLPICNLCACWNIALVWCCLHVCVCNVASFGGLSRLE